MIDKGVVKYMTEKERLARLKLADLEENEIDSHARKLYYAYAERKGYLALHPSQHSEVDWDRGYCYLTNVNGILAKYKIYPNGNLRSCKITESDLDR